MTDALLASDNPVVPSDLAIELDVNEFAKRLIAGALGKVPYVGFALSALTYALWPSDGEDVWAEIEGRVEALVDEKISELVWLQTTQTLAGLQLVLDDYIYAARNFPDDPSVISEKWNSAKQIFLSDSPVFQSKGSELLLLPLFVQFANLYLFLLRDGALFGADWGWSPALVDSTKAEIVETIDEYSKYTNEVYQAALAETKANAPWSPKHNEPYDTVNYFIREMQLTVIDFTVTWPYFNVIKYPDPVEIPVTREIYSQLVGAADDTGVSLPAVPPTEPIRKIIVWAWDRIDAAQVDYPAGGGPDGSATTGRMGNSSGGSDQPPGGGIFDLAQTGQVTLVKALSWDALNALWFTFEDGSTSHQLGGRYPGGNPSEWAFPGEILSSIKIMGVSKFYGSANAAVFGFKFKDERFPPFDPNDLRIAYIADPAQPAPAAFAEKLGLNAAGRTDVERWAVASDWDGQRQAVAAALRERVGARAKA